MYFVKWYMCEIYLPVLCWKITRKLVQGKERRDGAIVADSPKKGGKGWVTGQETVETSREVETHMKGLVKSH